MSRLRRAIFWMPWPPPWWIWALAILVVLIAAAMALIAG
jgi:hypothetical protein